MHQSNVIQNKICTQRRHRNIFSELSQISVVHQSEVISFMIMHHRKSIKRASILKYSMHIKTKKKYICESIRKKSATFYRQWSETLKSMCQNMKSTFPCLEWLKTDFY